MLGLSGEQIWGVVRTVAAAVGGYFIAKGVIDEATLTAVLGGAGTVFIAVWSWISKKKV